MRMSNGNKYLALPEFNKISISFSNPKQIQVVWVGVPAYISIADLLRRIRYCALVTGVVDDNNNG